MPRNVLQIKGNVVPRNVLQIKGNAVPRNVLQIKATMDRPSGVPRNFFRGGGSTNSVEDRGQRGRGSGGR